MTAKRTARNPYSMRNDESESLMKASVQRARGLAEAKKKIERLSAQIAAAEQSETKIHWGHVGDVTELNRQLDEALHWAPK